MIILYNPSYYVSLNEIQMIVLKINNFFYFVFGTNFKYTNSVLKTKISQIKKKQSKYSKIKSVLEIKAYAPNSMRVLLNRRCLL